MVELPQIIVQPSSGVTHAQDSMEVRVRIISVVSRFVGYLHIAHQPHWQLFCFVYLGTFNTDHTAEPAGHGCKHDEGFPLP